jgi:predicted phosphate transport protein (TIGR00153 family)
LVLPVETEERVKRRALSVCQDHLRKVLEITRKVPQMVDCFAADDKEAARQVFAEIRKTEEEVDKARRMVSQELAQIGAILINREDFLRFTNLASEISDFCGGLAFWLLSIIEHGWKVPSDIKQDLVKLSEATLDTVIKLRETAMTLSYGSEKTLEKAKEVETAERIVDEAYRELEVKIINRSLEIHVMLLLRDITQLLENAADKAEDASDAARILSFAM